MPDACEPRRQKNTVKREEAVMGIAEQALDLSGTGFDYELIWHAHTERALDEAASLGLSPEEIAKTIVLHVTAAGDLAVRVTYARAVLPAGERLDLHKLRAFFGESLDVRLATEPELADRYPELELGAVPPLGGPSGEIVIVDPRLVARESIVFEAGRHDQSVRMRTADLRAYTKATVIDICRE